MPSSLDGWFARANKQYASREAAAKKLVKSWEWWTRPGRTVEPLWQQRHERSAGKRLVKPPAKPMLQNTAYGIDSDGRVVVDHEYIYQGRGYYRTFYAWAADQVEWVRYDDDKQVHAVHRARLEAGRVVACECRGVWGGYTTTYEYAGGMLARIDDRFRSEDYAPMRREYEVTWDEVGRLVSITMSTDGGKPRLVFEAPRKGVTLEAVLQRAGEQLVEEIPARVRARKIREPAFCVVVAYPGEGNDNFPPTVGVGLERERADLVAKGVVNPSDLWNAGDFEHYDTELDEDGVAPIYATANRMISQAEGWKQMAKAFAGVARALRELDWSKTMPITKDFVVIAVDYDETALASALRAAVTPKTYAMWKKQKWAP